jgi:hypothetical protein
MSCVRVVGLPHTEDARSVRRIEIGRGPRTGPDRARTKCRHRVRCSVGTSRIAESDSGADFYVCLLLAVFLSQGRRR